MMRVRFLLGHCLCLLLFMAAQPFRLLGQFQKYEGMTVENIQFRPAEQPLEASELHDILPLQMKQPLTSATVRESIGRLFETGHYSDIQVDAVPYQGGVAITFITKNSWFIGDVSVRGKVSSPPNRGQLQNATDLGLGQPFSDDKVDSAVSEMTRLLEANGLFESNIRTVFDWETTRDYQQVNIRFEVDSGPRDRFAMPKFTGDLKMDVERLMKAMNLRRFLLHTWKPMTQPRVRQGVNGVRHLYEKEDRLEAKVTLDRVQHNPELNSATPELTIFAGPQIEIKSVGAKVSSKEMKRLVPVYEEHAVDHDLLVEGTRNLTDHFQSKGYFDAEVQFKEQNIVNDKAVIDFLVNTGGRHRLVNIDIQGNRYFNRETIRERMYLQTRRFLQFPHGRYSGTFLRRDEDAVRSLYLANGFQDVKVGHVTEDDYRGKSGDISVTIQIEEGVQTFVRSLRVDGLHSLDRDKILATLSSVPGQPFSEFNVAVDRDTILARYFENGFPDATFEWKPTPAAEPNNVDLVFTIEEGKQQFVRQVLITGNRSTRVRLVNQTITLNPGDPLSPTQMTETQRRLYDLGVFAKVDTAIQNPDGATDHKYVLYNVDEARKYSIAVGLGAEVGRIGGCRNCLESPAGATGFSPRVSFDVTRGNLWGLTHSLSLRTRVSTLDQRALLTYTWPRFWSNENLTLSFTGLFQDSRNVRTFNYQREEGSVQLTQKYNKAITLFYRATYRHVTVSDLQVTPFLIGTLSQPDRVTVLSMTMIEDRRDDPLDPHRGRYNTLDVGVAAQIFGSKTGYFRFLGRNATYHPLTKRLVLARSLEVGNIYGFNNTPSPNSSGNGDVALDTIPLPERFFGGGGTSHRGFPEQQAGPRDPSTGFPLGGTALIFNQTELRFPLIGDNIGGVLYHDMGNIYSSIGKASPRTHQQNIEDFNYSVHAVGIGLRYRTPVGPVRADFGYSINPPRFFGFKGTSEDLINAGVNPCAPQPNGQSFCVPQSVSHFQFFISIGQTF
jgi:outer membrane protein assembly complex protein YaeT